MFENAQNSRERFQIIKMVIWEELHTESTILFWFKNLRKSIKSELCTYLFKKLLYGYMCDSLFRKIWIKSVLS